VRETSAAGDASRFAREAYAAGRRHFIAVGGDGTSYEIVNGLFPLVGEPKKVPVLAFLPLGTGNSFLRDFTTEGEAHAIRSILEGKRRPCDVVKLTHRDGELHYINLLSFGFVADVCARRNRQFSAFGQLGYVFGVVREVAGLKPHRFPIRADEAAGNEDPSTFVSINNSRFTGGTMMMAPHADTGDGRADLIEVGAMGRFELLRAFPQIFKGTHVDLKKVRESKVKSIEFDVVGEVDAMVDGEVTRLWPKRLDVLPGALEVCA